MSRPAPLGRRALLALLGAAPLAGCGFTPVYAPGRPAAAMDGRVSVPPLPGRAGFALQERLTERLGQGGPGAHRLEIAFDLREEGAAITQDNITTRFLVLGEARFALYPPGAADPVLDGTVRSQTGYSAPANDTASAFAARAASLDAQERVARDLADRIVLRLSVTAGDWLAPA